MLPTLGGTRRVLIVRVHTVVTVPAWCAVQELALVQGFHAAAGNVVNLSALVKLTSLDLSRSR